MNEKHDKNGHAGVPFKGGGTRPEIQNPAPALREAAPSSKKTPVGGRLQDYGNLDIPGYIGIHDLRAEAQSYRSLDEFHTRRTIVI